MKAWCAVPTRLGRFLVAAEGGAIVRTALPGSGEDAFVAALGPDAEHSPDTQPLPAAVRQLREWSDGRRRDFDLPLRPQGTEFQRAVWRALRQVPHGETRSYADIAAEVGRPGAARAVGQANRRNPVAPFVPCHRVVAADGGLGGFMGATEGGGTALKRAMLEMERSRPGGRAPAPPTTT